MIGNISTLLLAPFRLTAEGMVRAMPGINLAEGTDGVGDNPSENKEWEKHATGIFKQRPVATL